LRDAVASALRVDDGDERTRWQYGQVETRGETGVVVCIEVEDRRKQRQQGPIVPTLDEGGA